MNSVLALINRILRIWPCLIITVLICWQIFPYSGNGPVWFSTQTMLDNCNNYWYRDLTFSNNFGSNSLEACLGWGWYLSLDV